MESLQSYLIVKLPTITLWGAVARSTSGLKVSFAVDRSPTVIHSVQEKISLPSNKLKRTLSGKIGGLGGKFPPTSSKSSYWENSNCMT